MLLTTFFSVLAVPYSLEGLGRIRSCSTIPPLPSQFVRRCHPYARKSISQAVLSRMQLTLHATRRIPHGASRLVLAMSAWSVETRRAPSRHCRVARVYDHTTTAMHDDEYTPPSRFLLVSLLCGPRLHRRVGRDKYAFRRVSIGASCRRTVVNCLVRTTSHGGTVCSIQCVARAVFLYTSDAAPPW